MKNIYKLLIAGAIVLSTCKQTVHAQTSTGPMGSTMSYQGKLLKPDGTPLSNGTHIVTFKIYSRGEYTGFTRSKSVVTLERVMHFYKLVECQPRTIQAM